MQCLKPVQYLRSLDFFLDSNEFRIGPVIISQNNDNILCFGLDFLRKIKGELILEFWCVLGWIKSTAGGKETMSTEYPHDQLNYIQNDGTPGCLPGCNFKTCASCLLIAPLCACLKVNYCDKLCQRKHWKIHKIDCTVSANNNI